MISLGSKAPNFNLLDVTSDSDLSLYDVQRKYWDGNYVYLQSLSLRQTCKPHNK